MKSFNQYISTIAEAKNSKTPCAKIFERLVFGYKRGKGFNNESDTPQEGRIRRSVEDWIGTAASTKQVVRDFEKIKECASKYPDEFKPTVEEAWRGIGTDMDRISKWISFKKLMESTDVLQIGSLTYVGVPVQYKPGKDIESWAAEPAVAARFAVDNSGGPYGSNVRDIKYVKELMNEYVRWKNTGKRSEDFDERNHILDMREAIQFDYEDLLNGTVPVVFRIKADKNCVFSEWFANALGMMLLRSRESEVTRVASRTTTVPGTMYIPKTVVDNMIRYENLMDEVVENIPKLKGVPRLK